MARQVERRLAWYLSMMRTEELQEFQLRLRLPEKQPCGPSRAAPAPPEGEGHVEVASRLVAQYGEQQAWDLALHTWEQMGLSRLCAEARVEEALMSGASFSSSIPCSPSAPSAPSPSRPTSTEVLRCLQGPEGGNPRPQLDTATHMWRRGKADPSWPLFQAHPSSPDQESPLQESPSAPTSTAVLGHWESPPLLNPEPGGQEAPEAAAWPRDELSGDRQAGEALQSRGHRAGGGRGRLSPGPPPQSTPVTPHHAPSRPSPAQRWQDDDLHPEFTQLLLLHRAHPRGHESLAKGSWHHGTVEKQGHLIEVKDLFGPVPGAQEEPHTVVLLGDAGVGKSTMARWVQRAWEEGLLFTDRFRHVVYVNCRELYRSEATSLSDLIAQGRASPGVPVGHILSQPEHLLLILDDLGEPKWVLEEWRSMGQRQPVRALLDGLLGRRLLPRASLLVTARTTALRKLTSSLQQPRWVEVLGFSESTRKEYFHAYFQNESQAVRAFSLVESNQALLSMCLVPLAAWMACTCLKRQMERGREPELAPRTATALCLHYLSQALPAQPLGAALSPLCSLAAQGIWRGKSLFGWGDLRKHGLDPATISTLVKAGVLRKHPCAPSYGFRHLCLQELFAAVCCVLGGPGEQSRRPDGVAGTESLLEAYGNPDLFGAPTTRFLFGLLSKQGERDLASVFTARLREARRRELLRWAEAQVRSQPPTLQPGSLQLLRCVYEVQDEGFLTQAMAHFRGARLCAQTGLELLASAFCVKFCCQVERLQLNEGGRRGQARASRTQVTRVPSLRLSWAPVTDAGWRVLFSTLRATGNLKELDLSGNCLSPSAVQSLCEALKAPSCRLETVRLAGCGLSAEGCKDLASGLSTSRTLTELELSFNSILDAGAEHLCGGLARPGCGLRRLLLVGCGLTSGCCRALASTLGAGPLLTELDLQQNELGDDGVRLLCAGLRHPACALSLLAVDRQHQEQRSTPQTPLPPPHPGTVLAPQPWGWALRGAGGGQTGDPRLTTVLPVPEGSPHQKAQVGPLCLPSPALLDDLHAAPLGTEDDFWGPLGPVATTVVDKERSLYRVHLPAAGSYQWPNTGLRFVVRGPATIDIEFCAWNQHLPRTAPQHSWVVAGPLFDIKAEPGAVAAVSLPHFVDLQGDRVDRSLFQVAHFKEEGMLLEKPAQVEPAHVVLENPSFSPIGVLLRALQAALGLMPVTCSVLLYHHPCPDEVAFHLYLIPSDGSIRKELELCYRSPGEPQLFSEFYVSHLGSGIRLQMRDKKNGTVVWEALLKPGDLRPAAPLRAASPPGARASLHFLDWHREQLVARVTSVDTVLDRLHGQLLSEEQYEQVRAAATRPDQMRTLLSFSRSWDWACKDQVYRALKEAHPHLIMELWEKWGGGRHRERRSPPPTSSA
uniref:NLR family pyrin domain containing 1 n=1 Tax=Suricata suricatta TaxID=37032 RepID=A0A673VC87_SURSU